VLITVMRGHQKYFAVEHGGSLAPRFIAVMNLDADRTGAIRHGHERVLRARFNDARFFWETDAKITLEQRLEMLKHVTFQSQLGSYYDKALRMETLAIFLGVEVAEGLGNIEIGQDEIRLAARLTKCDLTTQLVKEFTELQGIVGGLLAERDGLAKEVVKAIYDQYRPQSMEDASPRTLTGALVSLADRMDTLAGCFGVGLAPSGSKDPLALRRAAQGVIRILNDHRIPLKLGFLAGMAVEIYKDAQSEGKVPEWKSDGIESSMTVFLVDRLRYYLRDIRGFAYDEVNAVISACAESETVENLLNAVEAVSRVRHTENFEPLAIAFKRIKNILQQAEKSIGFTHGEFNPALSKTDAEMELFSIFTDIRVKVIRLKRAGNYLAALEVIASLRPTVDWFFKDVLVMDSDFDIRRNRLSLLASLLQEFSTIADFSEIVTKEETKKAS
ncbi:MAG: glycine--tRNA ligase subunit beta, partial [Acidobacteria bacterium]|nr:glycine--tRNA ligase subunit beta [Acidobacteriota bacterium]